MKICAESGLSETDKDKPQELWKLLETQLKFNINFGVHRLELMRVRQKKKIRVSMNSLLDVDTRKRLMILRNPNSMSGSWK